MGTIENMDIDLDSFERELAIDATIPADEIALDQPNVRVLGDVQVDGKLTKSAAVIALDGRLTGESEVDCDRCLEPQKRPIDIELDLEFVPEEVFAADANLELNPGDLKLDALPEHKVDLTEIAREQILLDLPQQFFCRPDCRGLCPKCGTNWNLQSCDCEDTEIDPRWSALKNLN